MSYAIIGLLFVLVIVFSILAAKTWHWVNIVFLNLVFLTGVTASLGLSQSLKLRYDAMKDAIASQDRADRLNKEADEALNGPADGIAYGPDSLRHKTEELERELFGRGRVWSSGSVSANAANRVFQFAAARGDGEVKLQDIVVYAFSDQQNNEGLTHPVNFIGTFRVISETPAQVELEPLFIADTNLNDNMNNTWSLFEKMPIDRRDAIKKVEGINDEDLDISAYRAIVMKWLPAQALGFDLSNQDSAKAYESLIDRYTFDGLTIGAIANWINSEVEKGNQRLNAVFEAAPEETFIEFRFTKKTDAVFEVDATANLSEDGHFNGLGQATDPSLHAGGKVGFDEGDTVLIDQRSAEGFQRAPGVNVPPFTQLYSVEETNRYFFRQMKDYPALLSNLERETQELQSETVRVRASNVVTQNALDDANGQITERTDIASKLTSDLENFRKDRDVISSLLDSRTKQLEDCESRIRELRGQLDNLYKQIHGAITSKESPGGRRSAARNTSVAGR